MLSNFSDNFELHREICRLYTKKRRNIAWVAYSLGISISKVRFILYKYKIIKLQTCKKELYTTSVIESCKEKVRIGDEVKIISFGDNNESTSRGIGRIISTYDTYFLVQYSDKDYRECFLFVELLTKGIQIESIKTVENNEQRRL